jgi:MFS superfamily sulfate permease-like transporter
VVAAIPLSWALDLASHGVAVVGSVPSGLPRPWLPRGSFGEIAELLPAAVAIFVVTFADEILTARSFAGRRGQNVRAAQELLAMSAADLASALTRGFTVGASPSRTAVNDTLGARTQVSGAAASVVIALVLLFVTAPLQYLPTPVLAAVLVSVGIGLIDLAAWRSLYEVDRVELAIAGVTFGAVVAVGVLQALITAVALSIVDTVRRSARPNDAVLGWVERLGRYADVSLHPSAVTTPGVVVYRLDDRLFFANAGYVKGRVIEAVRGAPVQARWLVFDAESINHTDSTGLEALEQLAADLERGGVGLCVARLRTRLRPVFEAFGLVERIGADRFYGSVPQAVEACVELLREEAEAAAGTRPA